MHGLTFVTFFFTFIWLTDAEQQPCVPRTYGFSSTVCVCNDTYCDETPPPSKQLDGSYLVYTSSQSGLRFHRVHDYFTNATMDTSDFTIINTDPTIRYQTILGWGGAFTDATGINVNSLNETGLQYDLCRVPIGGTDFSTRGYSYDDGEEDAELLNFKLAYEDHLYKIPIIKAAQNVSNGRLRLFASAWTAPKWMKHNGEYTGPDVLKKNMYQPWANYFLKFLEKYLQEGVEFWGITTGNEPMTGLIPSLINSVGWLPCQMSQWISENLGPTIRNSEFSSIKLITIDDQLFMFPFYTHEMLEDQKMEKYVDGFGLHYYWNWLPKSILTNTQQKFPNKFILATEACEGVQFDLPHVKLGDWQRGESYAHDMIGDLNSWVAGWVDWNMALNPMGGPSYIANYVDSPIIINVLTGEFYKQPMYYALGHFSKFIPRGSQRVKFEQSNGNLEVSTFIRPDKGIVLVILNRNNHEVHIKIKSIDNKVGEIKRIIERRSIATVLYWC